MTAASSAPIRPGDVLLHPVALVALAFLILNDHILKSAWPSAATGKLSDIAGLIVTPLVLVAVWEIALWAAGRWRAPSRSALGVAIGAVAIGFATTQAWPPAADAYRLALGLGQWPFMAIGALIGGTVIPGIRPVVAVADAEDLVALPVLAVTWWVGSRRVARSKAPAPAPAPADPASGERR